MAKKGSVGEYICGHCGATSMTVDRYVNKGYGTTRIILTCNKCKQEDYYDSTEGGNQSDKIKHNQLGVKRTTTQLRFRNGKID